MLSAEGGHNVHPPGLFYGVVILELHEGQSVAVRQYFLADFIIALVDVPEEGHVAFGYRLVENNVSQQRVGIEECQQ